MKLKHQQRGIGLVEITLVLGIVALLSLVVFVIYPRVDAARRGAAERSMIRAASANLISTVTAAGAQNFDLLSNLNFMSAPIMFSLLGSSISDVCHDNGWGGLECVSHFGNRLVPNIMGECADYDCSGYIKYYGFDWMVYQSSGDQCLQTLQGGLLGLGIAPHKGHIEVVIGGQGRDVRDVNADPSALVDACMSGGSLGELDYYEIMFTPWGDPFDYYY